MEKLVSVIMSTYNTKKEMLEKSIESILNQSYKNIEFIIVFDGSIDEYNYVLEKYKDERIKPILHINNEGLPKSLNEAIKKSNGEYIMRMDSDDISLRKRIKNQVKFLEKNKKIEICGMKAKQFGDEYSKSHFYYKNPEKIEIQMLYIPVLIHPTVMFRKNFFNDKKNYYNEEYLCAQDYELWSRVVNNRNIAIVNKYGIMYRIHNKQAGQQRRQMQLENTKKIFIRNSEKIVNTQYKEIAVECFEKLYGFEKIDIKDIETIKEKIDTIINNSKNFSKKELKKVFYNRLAIQIIKTNGIKKIIKNKKLFKIINMASIRYIFWYCINK
jgi:glycosyltransferase involved in cell wall biosynthesis